jgi:hypothetical protein
MSKAGNFEIEISPPYPCWITLFYNGEELQIKGRPLHMTHKELSDLKYAVEKAMQEAALRNETIRQEVYL